MPSNTMKLLSLEPDQTLMFRKKDASSATAQEVLKFTNKSTGFVAFKVKTTAPKSYIVRPSAGVLKAGQTAEVQIILQPQGGDVQANQHRFLVQAVPTTSATLPSRDEWTELQNKKETIQEQRLNVSLDHIEADSLPKSTDEAARATNITHPEDLQVKYDELVRFTLDLEKKKKTLEGELALLQSPKGGASSSARRGYSTMHLILVAVLAFLMSWVGPSPLGIASKMEDLAGTKSAGGQSIPSMPEAAPTQKPPEAPGGAAAASGDL